MSRFYHKWGLNKMANILKHIPWMKIVILWLKFLWNKFKESNWSYVGIDSGNGSVPKRRWVITWTYDVPVHWRTNASSRPQWFTCIWGSGNFRVSLAGVHYVCMALCYGIVNRKQQDILNLNLNKFAVCHCPRRSRSGNNGTDLCYDPGGLFEARARLQTETSLQLGTSTHRRRNGHSGR